jgi:heat shock protein HslJ
MRDRRYCSSVLVLVVLAAAACGSGTQGPANRESEKATPPTATDVAKGDVEPVADNALPAGLAGSWTLVEIDGAPVTKAGKTPTMDVLEDGTVSGIGGVNRYSTRLEVTEGRIDFGPTASTKMAGPPEAMALENAFFTRLGSVSNYQIESESLRLWAGDNEALTFERTDR